MKTTTIKGLKLLFFVGLLFFTGNLSAQIVLTIQGNVSDQNGNPIASHDVYFSDDTTGFNFGTAITNSNGDYSGVFTASPNTPIGGILFVTTEDCNFNMVLNTHAFTSTTPLPIISDFIICAGSPPSPCSLTGVNVSSTPNGLSVFVNGGTPPYTYIWSNGTTGYWSQFYQNWCVSIVDANGCDTTLCDTTILQPCYLSGVSVTVDSNTNTMEATWGPNYDYYWYNGDTTQSTSYYPNWCVYVVDSNTGCDTTICEPQNNISCQADFVSYLIGFNPNAVPVMVQFNDLSLPQGSISSWLWDFGDGTTDNTQNPVHSYQVPGVYYACLTITANLSNGTTCTSIFCDSVWADTTGINPPPPPSCYADFYSTQVSASDSTFFFNMSGGTTNTTSYFWDFGDGSTSTDENPTHLYSMSGWYYICLTIMDSTNNCYSTYCDYINIIIASSGSCQAYFSGSPAWTPNTYEFYDYSAGNISSWLWDFGDGNTSNLQNPVHTYTSIGSGFYLVCLIIEEIDPVTGSVVCTDTYCDSIYLINQQTCFADFYGQDLGNNEVSISNLSSPQTGPTWVGVAEVDVDYGDGNIAYNIGSSITYTYTNAGTYYVCVTVKEADSSGNILCIDSYCDSVTVTSGTMPCQADFCFLQDSIWITTNPNGTITTSYLGDVFLFCDLSTPVGYIQSYSWNMGGAGTYLMQTSSISSAPIFEYDTFGVYYPCLTITTFNGCTSTSCDTISFQPMIWQFVNSSAIEGLKLYPNPANERLNISFTSLLSSDVEINVINMMGQKVLHINDIANGNTDISLDVSHLSDGVYSVVVVFDGSEKQYKRFVINR
ncbi:MAG: PKD domain-containing protein [Flavobacteriales bacterium]|nr:PKD domain-containing protein [Flavobacteriales bacterium]